MNLRPILKPITFITALAVATAPAAPQLQILRSGANVDLKWPAADSGWYLQTTASLKNGPWVPVQLNPVSSNGYLTVTQPIQAGPHFYRLAAQDDPDSNFTDSNGDGIDGDASRAIFVYWKGSDSNAGTRQSPVATIAKGIALAAAKGWDVYIGNGVYVPVSTVNLVAGVSLYGQYNPENNWSRSAANVTQLKPPTSTAILAQGIGVETRVEGLTITAEDASATGSSSYGVRVISCSGPIVLRNNKITAGKGSGGAWASDAANGSPGGDGLEGAGGKLDDETAVVNGGAGGSSAAGHTGGKGGNGGKESSYKGGAGSAGWGGTAGGSGGNGGDPGTIGGKGADGANGADGTNGIVAASKLGTVIAGFYVGPQSGSGTAGVSGNGGGGGGGGGGQTCTFCNNGAGNAGGGGGGGGEGGDPGQGGYGGGGSFAVLCYNSNVTIADNSLTTSKGGDGGSGGSGGLGAAGGTGGLGGNANPDEIGLGGKGGQGGRGGNGGNGAGGHGGPSIAIFKLGSAVTASGNVFVAGLPGAAGKGGIQPLGTVPPAPAGLAGVTANSN